MTDKICRLAWQGFSNDPDGKVRPCCLYKGHILDDNNNPMYVQTSSIVDIFKSKYMVDLRNRFRNNTAIPECTTCWTDESNGFTSKRMIANDMWKNVPIDFSDEPELPIEFQMIINNTCNLKCVSCTPSHSSLWQAENIKVLGHSGYEMPNGQVGNENSLLWEQRHQWYDSVQRLEVVGGEPFYVKQWHQIFNELIESGRAKDITVNMSTNCTLFYGELLERMIQNFKHVGIGLSVDGVGSVYEYLRFPGNWETVYGNMQKYHALSEKYENFMVQVNCTIGWVNAVNITKLHELVYNEFPKFKIWNNLIHWPLHMALHSASDDIKAKISEAWDQFDWQEQYRSNVAGMKNHMISTRTSDKEFLTHLSKVTERDSIRGLTFNDAVTNFKG